MEKDDIVPELIEEVQRKFQELLNQDKNIQNLINLLKEGKATYTQANDYAIGLGELMSKALGENITSDILPDEKMYFNIADRVLNEALGTNYRYISKYCEEVQDGLNQSSGINLKPQISDINQDRVDGIVNRISSEPFDKVKWLLDEPIVNFSQSIVDDAIKENVEFHAEAGFSPKIVRKSTGKCCDWCEQLAGVYEYKSEPAEVYHRHRYCRCTVDYVPDKNKRQNVWSKKWSREKSSISLNKTNDILHKNSNTNQELKNNILGKREEYNSLVQEKEVRVVAYNKIMKMAEVEPEITKDLKLISKGTNGTMVGLDNRLKSQRSLTRKILLDVKETGLSAREVARSVNDVLRYTVVYEDDNFTLGYRKIVESLNDKGYNIIRVKNTFKDQEAYKGINTIIRDKKGNLFDLQFHTPKSIEIKENGLHQLYEQQRSLDKIKDKVLWETLTKKMIELSDTIPIPEGIERIK